MTDWGRSRRAALMLVLGPLVIWAAACASSTATIPPATPSPSAATTTIAPGVSVKTSELTLPPYSVSASNPLPAGITARNVIRDFIADNLIENRAVEREDPQLLQYAVTGGLLSIDDSTIARDQASGSRILNIDDSISSLAIGSESDPNDSAATIALNVEGVEQTATRNAQGKVARNVDDFHVIIWVVWSETLDKYLRCDVSVL
ncbi:MAG: hypothetical protein WAO09_00440 [Candidatus Dormiibacterota bacterium]